MTREPIPNCPMPETPIRDRAWTDEQIQQAADWLYQWDRKAGARNARNILLSVLSERQKTKTAQIDACHHRCQRMHAHCELRIGRIVAPDKYWRWVVTMPDGHLWETGKSHESPFDCLADAKYVGFASLMGADKAWRSVHTEEDTQP